MGSPNAPPIVGAVHRMPREPHDSPPPAPEPQLANTSLIPDDQSDGTRRSSVPTNPQHMPSGPPVRHASTPFTASGPLASPGQYQTHMTSSFQPPAPVAGPPPQHTPMPAQQTQNLASQSSQSHMRPLSHQQQQNFPQSSYTPSSVQQMQHQQVPLGFNHPAATAPRAGIASGVGVAQPHNNMYNPPRPPEVYTLTEVVNEAFADDISHQFQCDASGRGLFFTSAPLDRTHQGLSSASAAVGHSARYLAGRQEWLAERARKRKLRDEIGSEQTRKKPPSQKDEAIKDELVSSQAREAMETWFENFESDTARWTEATGLRGWNPSVNA